MLVADAILRLIAFVAAFDQTNARKELYTPTVQVGRTEPRVVSVEWGALVVVAGADRRSRP